MQQYRPWKFVVCLPIIMFLEGLHIVCEGFRLIDNNLICPAGESLEDWLSD